jgi:hypothetical protein
MFGFLIGLKSKPETQESKVLIAGNWTWFTALSEDNYNHRDEEGFKQILYDCRRWTCQGTIDETNLKRVDSRWAESEQDCLFVLVHDMVEGHRWGKKLLLYTAPMTELNLSEQL